MKSFLLRALILFLAAANGLVWYAVWQEDRRGILTVAFLDVGQGDAIFIEAPNGNQVLVDAGAGRQVLRALGEVMPFYDRTIDLVIATHPDADHIGGLLDVFRRFQISGFMESGVLGSTALAAAVEEAAAAEGAARLLARRGQRVILSEGIFLEILFPDRPPPTQTTNPNDWSVAARLARGEQTFLLTGDAPAKIEQYLVSLDGGRLRSAVLKAGHHGSRTSSAAEFLAAVRPRYAVISAGKQNRYGHPHEEVLGRLRQAAAEVFSTAEAGTIIFQSDGVSLRRR